MRRTKVSSETKRFVTQRAQETCEYCLYPAKYCPDSFSVEHIEPFSTGGTNDAGNLALSCQGCNNFRFTRIQGLDPVTSELVPLYNPRRDLWRDHFMWGERGEELIGITPVGRASIYTLRLNRAELVNFRRLLYNSGEHPLQIASANEA